jgi:nucleoside-diphosphate-sugar epimerase
MHYLVTGGAGFIGSHLAEALVARGHDVTLLDDLSTGSEDNVRPLIDAGTARLVVGTTLDQEVVGRLVGEADAVIHLAATVGVELVVRDPLRALRNNIDGTELVLDACALSGAKVLVASTSEIYGKNSFGKLREDADRIMGSASKARWAYATSKAVDEILAYEHWRQRGTPTVVARLFNCAGPRQSGTYGMVVPRFVRQALTGVDLTVFGDGTQTRCFCHVDDTVAAIVGLMQEDRAVGGVFNVGADHEISIEALATRVIELVGSTSAIRRLHYEDAYEPGFEDMVRRVPDTTRIQSLIGWEPTRTLDEILKDIIGYERNARGTG